MWNSLNMDKAKMSGILATGHWFKGANPSEWTKLPRSMKDEPHPLTPHRFAASSSMEAPKGAAYERIQHQRNETAANCTSPSASKKPFRPAMKRGTARGKCSKTLAMTRRCLGRSRSTALFNASRKRPPHRKALRKGKTENAEHRIW